jgi:serine protease Do
MNIRDERSVISRYVLLISFSFGLLLPTFPWNAHNSVARESSKKEGALSSFSSLVKEAKNSIVNISTVKIIKEEGSTFNFRNPFGDTNPFEEFFDRFFEDQIPREYRQRSLGSGFIIDEGGHILTNNHVVEKTEKIKVTLANNKEYEARVIGMDSKTDLALIRTDPDEPLAPLTLGDSDKLEVGEWVVAIGNPYGLDHTVTAGIVSAKYRQIGSGLYDNFIQTDASINPGSSGGPLLNILGEVVGINSIIYSENGSNIGVGFAIPINLAKDLIPHLKKGNVERGWLGVTIQAVTEDLKEKFDLKDGNGALVNDVIEDSPAEKAGIIRGDVIISFDNKEVNKMDDLSFIIASIPVGKTVTVGLIRKGEKKSFKVKVGEFEEAAAEEEEAAESTVEEEADLGMVVKEITRRRARRYRMDEREGLIVVQVATGSQADEAGIRSGDIILEVDQEPISDLAGYKEKIRGFNKGDTILFLIKREDNTLYLTLKIWE